MSDCKLNSTCTSIKIANHIQVLSFKGMRKSSIQFIVELVGTLSKQVEFQNLKYFDLSQSSQLPEETITWQECFDLLTQIDKFENSVDDHND